MDPQDYLDSRIQLAKAWQRDQSFMSFITPTEQWDLHAYFEFHKQKSDEDALAWLETIYENEPQIEEAGIFALEQLILAQARLVEQLKQEPMRFTYPNNRKGISVRAIVKPELDEDDFKRLSRLLIAQVRSHSD